MEKTELGAKLAQFIATEKNNSNPTEILESTDLFLDGHLDSLFCLRLLTHWEKLSGKRFPLFLVSRENFRTINALANILDQAK